MLITVRASRVIIANFRPEGQTMLSLFQSKIMLRSRKYPYPLPLPPQTGLQIPGGGGGSSMVKTFKGKYEAKLAFSEWGGGGGGRGSY